MSVDDARELLMRAEPDVDWYASTHEWVDGDLLVSCSGAPGSAAAWLVEPTPERVVLCGRRLVRWARERPGAGWPAAA